MISRQLDYQSVPWKATGGYPDRAEDDTDTFITVEQLAYLLGCLADIPHLIADLQIAELKQDRFPARRTPTTDGEESPLSFRPGALRARERLTGAVWATAAMIWHRATHGQASPFRGIHDAAGWLADQPKLITQEPDAETIGRRIAVQHDRLIADHGPLDIPDGWRYLGICPGCKRIDLYAHRDDTVIICSCGWAAPIHSLVRRIVTAADDMLFTDTEITRMFAINGDPVTRDQVNGWARRGRITVHLERKWWNGQIQEVRMFRFSEVRALVEDITARKAG